MIVSTCVAPSISNFDPLGPYGPAFDLRWPMPLMRSYFVAATPRSGSTYLSDLLSQTGVLGRPYEYLNDGVVPMLMQRLGASSQTEYIRLLMQRRCTGNGVFGIKIFARNAGYQDVPDTIQWDCLGDEPAVFMLRRDLEAQVRSYVRARASGDWFTAPRKDQTEFAAEDLAEARLRLVRQNDFLAQIQAARTGPSLPVFYEDVLADPGREVARIAAFLSVPLRRRLCPR